MVAVAKKVQLWPITIVLALCIFYTKSQVQIKCGTCKISSCGGTNLCAFYYGQGFIGQEQCVTSCDAYPIVYYPSYCEIDSKQNDCTVTKCCVSIGRTPTAQRTCTSNLTSVYNTSAYCDQILTNSMGFGIIIGSLTLGITIVAVACCILKFCMKDPNESKPYIPDKVRNHRRKPFSVANFYQSDTWRVFQQRNLMRQEAPMNIVQKRVETQTKMKKQSADRQVSNEFENTKDKLMKGKKGSNQQIYGDV